METVDTRSHLVDAALHLFGLHGYDATTVNAIVEAAGVSKGAFYHYFERKDDVLFLIHDEFIDHVLVHAVSIAQDQERTAEERLRLLIVDLVNAIATYRDHVTVFFQEQRVFDDDKRARITQKEERYVQILRDLIQEGTTAGIFRRDLDTVVVKFGILGMVNWTYKWLDLGGRLSPDEVGSMLATLVIGGLRAL